MLDSMKTVGLASEVAMLKARFVSRTLTPACVAWHKQKTEKSTRVWAKTSARILFFHGVVDDFFDAEFRVPLVRHNLLKGRDD